MEFNTYFVVFLRKGPAWTPEETPELEALQTAHLAHLSSLGAAGHLKVAGPCPDDGDLRGISLFCTATQEEAYRLACADPAVKAGRLSIEIHPWMVPAGSI